MRGLALVAILPIALLALGPATAPAQETAGNPYATTSARGAYTTTGNLDDSDPSRAGLPTPPSARAWIWNRS